MQILGCPSPTYWGSPSPLPIGWAYEGLPLRNSASEGGRHETTHHPKLRYREETLEDPRASGKIRRLRKKM